MGWRGAVRSMNAAIRAAERDAARRRKQLAHAQQVSEASEAVEDWQAAIHELISIHTNPSDDIDWLAVTKRLKPIEPMRRGLFEREARNSIERFKPRVWDFLFGGSARRREKLNDALPAAVARDDEAYRQALAQFRSDIAEWQSDTELARRLLAGDASAKREVIAEMQSLSSEAIIGSHITFLISDEAVHAVAHMHGDEVVPRVRRKQLQSGRLSETKMPAGEFNELFQDYVCSAALRIAGDLFGLLPVTDLYVTCMPRMLNPKTGHIEATPVLSVWFVRETFRRLNLRNIDPSDATANFVHRMDFKRSKGFAAIEPLRAVSEI